MIGNNRKKPYSTPTLILHGDLNEITQGHGNSWHWRGHSGHGHWPGWSQCRHAGKRGHIHDDDCFVWNS